MGLLSKNPLSEIIQLSQNCLIYYFQGGSLMDYYKIIFFRAQFRGLFGEKEINVKAASYVVISFSQLHSNSLLFKNISLI